MTFPNDISFSIERVRKELDNLNVAKSGGPDLIPPRIFYEVRSYVEETLSHVFQLPWDTGKIPNECLKAEILPIYRKKGLTLATPDL